MDKPYTGAGVTHIVCGFLCLSAGVIFMLMLYMYAPFQVSYAANSNSTATSPKVSFLSIWPPWVSFLFASKIWCGFWFLLTGMFGVSVSKKGCAEQGFVALSVLNVIIWVPAILVLNAFLAYCLIWGFFIFELQGSEMSNTSSYSELPFWIFVFPAFGFFIGLIEFILSIVSYSIVCCCSPTGGRMMQGSRVYQYEMKA